MIEALHMGNKGSDSTLDHKRGLSIDSAIAVSTEQIWSDLVGEAVILDLKSGVYYGLDSVGAQIWKLLQESKTVSEIRDLLLAEYDVVTDRCETDLLLFLSDLRAKGLIEMRNETSD